MRRTALAQPPQPPTGLGETPLWLRAGSWLTHRFTFLARLNMAYLRCRDRLFPSWVMRLEQAIGDADSLLEAGCGDRSPLLWFRRRPRRTVGVDLHGPSIEHSRKLGIHDEYRQLDVLDLANQFEPGSFDAVVALDLIEHLSPEQGTQLLAAMERVARRRVVVFTPNGFLEQGEYGENPWQIHRSGWTPADMRARGYAVWGLNGLKGLRGKYATPRWRPLWFWKLASEATQPLAWRFPAVAFQMLAVKEVGD